MDLKKLIISSHDVYGISVKIPRVKTGKKMVATWSIYLETQTKLTVLRGSHVAFLSRF